MAPIVAITGQNGFISLHIAKHFLDQGWAVRGSVRTAGKAAEVNEHFLFKPFVESGKLELVVVPSFTEKESVAKLLSGATALAHIATPFSMDGLTFEDYRQGAIDDITNVLTLAAARPTIKAVSVMSSFVASWEFGWPAMQNGRVYTEEDWTPATEEDCKKEGLDPMSAFVLAYGIIKKTTEQVGVQVHKDLNATFALSFMRPTMVFGAPYDFATADKVSTTSLSSGLMASLLSGKEKDVPVSLGTWFVDARDVAQAFWVAITEEKSGPYIITAEAYDNQKFANAARKVRPDLDAFIPLGNPTDLPSDKGNYIPSNAKATKELGIKWKTTDEMLQDTLAYFETIGYVKA